MLDVREMLNWDNDFSQPLPQKIVGSIKRNQKIYDLGRLTKLDLICSANEVSNYTATHVRPNFVTRLKVIAKTTVISNETSLLSQTIVLIENSDPGFDWIFGHDISGLVTMYGGANSHMAIRCAEFQIPAAIGCGKELYERLLQANAIELDCKQEQVRPSTIQ